MLRLTPSEIRAPALATAHSHAFQRAMRGSSQRPADPSARPADDFWSWRGQMYRLANALTPESMVEVATVAYRELARAGVLTVGEFHYVHHQPDGTPYDDRTAMSDALVVAARRAGIRVALLRTAYHRAGPGRPAEPAQRRFCDPSADLVMRDVEALHAKYKDAPDVRVGVAIHSVRAVPGAWIRELAAFARARDLPLHAHVAEQPREIEECLAETGKRPLELFADEGALGPRFVAVHATHLLEHEARLLGEARGFACVCATTERDLGDGLPDLGALRRHGARLCTGTDSHVLVDAIEDLRALEGLERLRTQRRVTFAPAAGTPAEALWRDGSLEGAIACGFADAGGELVIRRDHPTLALVDEENLLDAIVFSGGAALVDRVERSAPV